MPELNTEVLNLFLEQFARELPAGVHAVLIWDGAGFHTGAGLVVPSNVSLIQLPPYSPELNPVENLWQTLVVFKNWAENDPPPVTALPSEPAAVTSRLFEKSSWLVILVKLNSTTWPPPPGIVSSGVRSTDRS
jgi:hypothetical protein